jgi:upstream activation factor subunit UAF30
MKSSAQFPGRFIMVKKKATKKQVKKAKVTAKKVVKKATKKAATKKVAKVATKKVATKKVATKKVAKAATKKVATKKVTATKKVAAPKATAKKVAKKAKTKRAPNPAFMRPLTPSAELAAVIGNKAIPRTEVVKKVWEYIKSNNLQDKVNRRNINADDKLKKVFGGKSSVTMFELTKIVSQHLS